MTAPYWLQPDDIDFPSVELALREPDGLLAVGGDLSVKRLLSAYANGIFPWYSENQPILWWSPDPRLVLYPANLNISKSLSKLLRRNKFTIRFDTVFNNVVHACAGPRRDTEGTWIGNEIQQAYIKLHEAGYAHSIEVWQNDKLVGGLYGVALGKVFFGESMFSLVPNASKIALTYLCAHLVKWQYCLIDCQVESPHLLSMGAVSISRAEFMQQLTHARDLSSKINKWSVDDDISDRLSSSGNMDFLV